MSAEDLERLRRAAERSQSAPTRAAGGASRAEVERRKAALPALRVGGSGGGDKNVHSALRDKVAGDGGGGAPSLLQQIPGAVFDAGRGLVQGLVPAAVDSTVGNVGALATSLANRIPGVDVSAQDVRDDFSILGRALINENTLESIERGDSFARQFDAAAPILTEPAKSFARTGRNLAELGEVALTDKGFGESSLAQASDEGRTVEWLLENVGNVAFAGRLGSGAAAAAASRAGRATPRLQRVADATRRVDDAIDKTLLAPVVLPAKGLARGARAVANSEVGQAVARSPLGQEARTRLLTPATRQVRDTMARFDQINAIRREDEAISPAKRVQSILAGIDDPTLGRVARRRNRRAPEDVRAAEGAMFLQLLDAEPIFGPLRPLREADEGAFDAAVTAMSETFGNDTLTPRAVSMYLDKVDGTLDPALASDIDKAAGEWVARANEGGLVRDVDGTRVTTGATPNYVAGTGRLTDTPDGPAQRAESLTSAERIFDDVDPEDLTSAPARFRESIALGRQLRSTLDDVDLSDFPLPAGLLDSIKGEILTTVDRGLATLDPAFVRGGRVPDATGGGPSGGTHSPKATKIAAQQVKGGGSAPLQVDQQAAIAANDIRRQTTNQMLGEIQASYGLRGDDLAEFGDLSGQALLDAVSEARGEKYVAWDPRKVFERSDDPTRTRDSIRTRADETTLDSVLMPAWVADAMDYAFKQDSRLAQVLIDKPTRVFKGAVLALAPRWILGNALSGAILLHAGKVSVADMVKYHRRARRAMSDYAAGRRSEVPREIFGTGYSAAERRLLDDFANSLDNVDFDEMATRRPKGRLRRAGGGVVRRGYDANTAVDDLYRSMAYLKKVDEGAPPQRAVKEALTVMGNYDRLTPFERRIVRRIFPFWSWTKHITGLSAKLATEDPARITWNLHLPTLFTPENAEFDGPEWMQGMAKVGEDRFFNLSWLFPFGTVAEVDPSNPLEFALGQINPVLQTGTTLATGIDTSFGRFEPLRSPDIPFGQSEGSPIFTNPLSVPYLVGRNLPQISGAYDELQRRRSGGEGQRLFDTGERMGEVDPNKDMEDNLARIFGIPLPRTYRAG